MRVHIGRGAVRRARVCLTAIVKHLSVCLRRARDSARGFCAICCRPAPAQSNGAAEKKRPVKLFDKNGGGSARPAGSMANYPGNYKSRFVLKRAADSR